MYVLNRLELWIAILSFNPYVGIKLEEIKTTIWTKGDKYTSSTM